MDNNYRKIVPEDVFVSIFDREATEEELWMGLPRNFKGNRPSGNDFIDLFARLVRQYQSRSIEFYAKIMGVEKLDFRYAIRAMTGMSPVEWRDRYTMLSAKELLRTTEQGVGDIARRMGFGSTSAFSRFFSQHAHNAKWRSSCPPRVKRKCDKHMVEPNDRQ